jgi:hypothetical protein
MDGNADGLAKALHTGVGAPFPIRLDFKGGPEPVVGALEKFEVGGTLELASGEQFHQGEIDGFTLLDRDGPIDHSDETRNG